MTRAWLVGLLAVAGCQGKPERGSADHGPSDGGEDRIAAGGVPPAANALAAPRPAKLNPDVGANLFTAMNCSGCHSGGGGTGFVGPSLVDGRWRYGGSDEEIFTSIFYGRPKGMPAFGGVMGTDAVWTVVAYLKAQTVPPVVPTTSWVPGGNASPEPSAPAPDTQP
jgi:cytochrome c oxidase cbb3-type subunit 3